MEATHQAKQPALALLVALLVCYGAQALGATLIFPDLGWYATLHKPGFTPPAKLFPVVWTILYGLMALSVWTFWRAPGSNEYRRWGLAWFCIQLVLGIAWSSAFFALHSVTAAFAAILALLLSIVVTIVMFDRLSRTAALLLVPYLLWVAFATALNFAFWYMNP
jgi:translocator protein